MKKSELFVALCACFALGLWLAAKFPVPPLYWNVAAAILISVLAIFWRADNRGNWVWYGALVLVFCLLGIWRMQGSLNTVNQFREKFDAKQDLEGIISADPDVREGHQLFSFRPKGFGQNILVTTDLNQQLLYGDWVWVTGKLLEPQNFNDFDYKGYLEKQNVYAVMRYPRAVVLKNGYGNKIISALFDIKHLFTAQIEKFLPQPKASLLLGILIGARNKLPAWVTDDFTATGLSHVLAVSGYNISVIVVALGYLAWWFGRKASFWLSLLLIAAFVVIAGLSASVIRAAIMGALLLLSFNIGRPYAVVPALSLAAGVMLLINPRILYWDAGFQLSFLATLGIVIFVPKLEELSQNWHEALRFWKLILFTTLAAIFATLPLILAQFGRLSVVAPLTNLLVLPVVPPVMFFGFFSALPFFGPGFALIAGWLLAYMLWLIHFFARLPFSSLQVKIGGASVWLAYALLAGLAYWLNRHLKKIKAARAGRV